MTDTWPEDIPSPKDRAYRCYLMDTADFLIRLDFQDKCGQRPQHIVEYLGMKWAGPVDEKEER